MIRGLSTSCLGTSTSNRSKWRPHVQTHRCSLKDLFVPSLILTPLRRVECGGSSWGMTATGLLIGWSMETLVSICPPSLDQREATYVGCCLSLVQGRRTYRDCSVSALQMHLFPLMHGPRSRLRQGVSACPLTLLIDISYMLQ